MSRLVLENFKFGWTQKLEETFTKPNKLHHNNLT